MSERKTTEKETELMVNNLEFKKLHVALVAVAALVVAALATVAMSSGLPAFELVYNMGFAWARAEWLVGAVLRANTYWGLVAMIGTGVYGLLYYSTFYVLKRIIYNYGFRAAVRY